MQCEHAQEFLSEYVTGDMDQALAVTLENHLRACEPCAEAVESLRRVWSTLDELPTIEPPATFHASLMERISADIERQERAAKAPVRLPVWRAFVQPRSFAYAAAAVALILGAELVQVQRAALGPVGTILNIVRPAPVLQMHKVEWMPNDHNGGTLTVRIQAHAQANGAALRQHARIEVRHADGTPLQEPGPALKEGEVSSDQPASFAIPLTFTPRQNADVVDVTLSSNDGIGEPRTVILPVTAVP